MSITLVHERFSHDRLYEIVCRMLSGTQVLSMATTSPDAVPHVNAAFFCFDDNLTFHFLSLPDSLHARNISQTGRMAAGVFDRRQPWGAPHTGLQLMGRAKQTARSDEDHVRRLYGARFPLYQAFLEGRLEEGNPKPMFFDLRFFTFTPSRVKILDESEFGDSVMVEAELVMVADVLDEPTV